MEAIKKVTCIEKFTVSIDSNLRDVINVIENGRAQVALVVSDEKILMGVITDGDIRRALLNGIDLDQPIGGVMNSNFHVLKKSAVENDVYRLMSKEHLRQMPLVDEYGRITDLFVTSDLAEDHEKSNSVFIMAGGEGKRLRPLTEQCPKPMLRIGDRPILEIILCQYRDAGFRKFYISVSYLKDKIKDYFGDGSSFGIDISYVQEDKPLGTAGALSLLPEKPTEPLLVMNGDLLTRVDFNSMLDFHYQNKADITLGVREHVTQIPYGVVVAQGSKVLKIEEKPVLRHNVNAGIYLISPRVIDMVQVNEYCDMPDLISYAIDSSLNLASFPIHEYWLDIGHKETLERAAKEWSEKY